MYILAECDIPNVVTGILSQVYKIILVLVPIGIVVFGSMDFIKAIAAKDTNAIAASTKTFISRLIAGGITFFVLVIVTWLFRIVLSSLDDTNSAMNCALQILGGQASSSQSHFDWIKDTADTVTNQTNCTYDCTNYYQSNSAVQCCQNYCRSGQKFNASEANCG